jgi:hypothetical protein
MFTLAALLAFAVYLLPLIIALSRKVPASGVAAMKHPAGLDGHRLAGGPADGLPLRAPARAAAVLPGRCPSELASWRTVPGGGDQPFPSWATIMRAIAWLAAAAITACLFAGCSSSPPPTPGQRFVTALEKVGLHSKRGQAAEISWGKSACNRFANAVENDPGDTDLIYPAAVTGAVRQGYTETQASTVMRAIINDFCPQWRVLLKQG